MIIKLGVNCVNCGELITQISWHVGETEETIVINASEFDQTIWECGECRHTTYIGDIDTIDSEDV